MPVVAASASLWLIDRVAMAADIEGEERCRPRLSQADLARAAGMVGVDVSRAWRVGRIGLRIVLEHLMAVAPDGAERIGVRRAAQFRQRPFSLTAHGEPSLPDCPLVFSQSDAGRHLLIGVSPKPSRIGVDLEQPRTLTMSAARQARVRAAGQRLAGNNPTTSVVPDLLQAWTRIEAFAKARGPSLARVLTELSLIGTTVLDIEAVNRANTALVAQCGLQIHDLPLPDGLIGAMALPTGRPVPQLLCLTPITLAELLNV
jgi:hypothetical protein